jgi:hypothetical protein
MAATLHAQLKVSSDKFYDVLIDVGRIYGHTCGFAVCRPVCPVPRKFDMGHLVGHYAPGLKKPGNTI